MEAMSEVQFWKHQREAGATVRQAVNRGQVGGLIVLPTGAGKTVLFLGVARYILNPALILVHRDELVHQTAATLTRWFPELKVGVVQADRDEWNDGEDIVVASVQSLHKRRLEKMPRDRFRLLV